MAANRDKTCPRCGLGIDDDGDGDCIICSRMPIYAVFILRQRLGTVVESAANIGRLSAFGEMNAVLRTTSKPNPVMALLDYWQRYPKHGDLSREMEAMRDSQVVIDTTTERSPSTEPKFLRVLDRCEGKMIPVPARPFLKSSQGPVLDYIGMKESRCK